MRTVPGAGRSRRSTAAAPARTCPQLPRAPADPAEVEAPALPPRLRGRAELTGGLLLAAGG